MKINTLTSKKISTRKHLIEESTHKHLIEENVNTKQVIAENVNTKTLNYGKCENSHKREKCESKERCSE